MTGNEATKCSSWCPSRGPPVGSALPFTGSSEASSPASTVLWRCATPCAPLAALRCLRLAIPCVAPVVSLPAGQDARPRAWGSCPVPTTGKIRREASRASQVPGQPAVPMPCSSTPAAPNTSGHCDVSTWPPLCPRRRLPRINPAFEAQSHGFGTRCLRFVRCSYPHPTQNSLPAAGQALPDGIGYPQGCYERFLTIVILPSRALPGARTCTISG